MAYASMSHLALGLPLGHRGERPGWWRTRARRVFDRARHCESELLKVQLWWEEGVKSVRWRRRPVVLEIKRV
jgi:hypothetical protein